MNEQKKKLPTKFVFSHNGDPSVGISGESVTVEYEGEFADEEYQKEFVDAIGMALNGILDFPVRVDQEVTSTCKYCGNDYTYMTGQYDQTFCFKNPECQAKENAKEQAFWDEQARLEQELIDSQVSEDLVGFDDWRENQERNQRLARSVNGAGLRN